MKGNFDMKQDLIWTLKFVEDELREEARQFGKVGEEDAQQTYLEHAQRIEQHRKELENA